MLTSSSNRPQKSVKEKKDLTVCTGNIRQQAFKLKAHNRGDYNDSSSPEWRLCWFISHTPRVVILTMRRDVLISTLFEGCVVKLYAEVEFCIKILYELPLVLEVALTANKPYQKCPSQRVRKKLAVHVARITAFCSEVPRSNRMCQATIVRRFIWFSTLVPATVTIFSEIFNTSLRWPEKAETSLKLPIWLYNFVCNYCADVGIDTGEGILAYSRPLLFSKNLRQVATEGQAIIYW